MTAATLNTIHNLTFYQGLMARLRQAIEEDRFASERRALVERLSQST
jgi:tRNA-guanine family transglycosylase